MIAVIRQGGKQFVIKPGQELKVEKIKADVGQALVLEDVLMVEDGGLKLGNPRVSGVKVTAKVLAHGDSAKVTGVKFHNKVRYRRKFGHRQPFTTIKIEKIA